VTASLGSAFAEGALDTTNRNVGNYTVTFDNSVLSMNAEKFECYHIAIDGPFGSSFQIFIGNQFYDNVVVGWQNSWDPSQTMKLESGQVIYFFWSVGPPATPVPTVTMYFQEASPL
jgi:hypothetical protein